MKKIIVLRTRRGDPMWSPVYNHETNRTNVICFYDIKYKLELLCERKRRERS